MTPPDPSSAAQFPRDRRSWIGALSSSLLILLSLPSFNLFPLAWFGLIPLLWVLRTTTWKQGFYLGWAAGSLFFVLHVYWIVPLYPYTDLPTVLGILVTLLATLALAIYLGIYWGVFALLLPQDRRGHWYWPILVAALWTGTEYTRAWMLSGMPWGSLGYSQWNNLPAIQIADTVGVYGISFILVLINASLLQLLDLWVGERRLRWQLALLPLVLLFLTYGYGVWRLRYDTPADEETLEVALIPGNVPQLERWKGYDLDKLFEWYLEPTRTLAEDPPDLFVWPETAVPMNLLAPGRAPYFLRLYQVLREIDRPMLFGNRYITDKKLYNAVHLLDAYGQPRQHYYKMHLVPFGEAVPLKKWLPRTWVDRLVGTVDYDPGEEIRLFEIPGKEQFILGTVICFESAFPRQFRKMVQQGANVMGILTNDAWFEGTSAPEQHYAMAPLRAVENRVPIFRCANGGISSIIDSFGRVQPQQIRAPEQGILRGNLSYRHETTLYTRFGNWLPFASWLYTCVIAMIVVVQTLRHRKSHGS